MISRQRQNGAALIVVLLVVTIIVFVSVTLNSDFLVLFRRVENQFHSQQAYHYLLGAEGLARQVILEDRNGSKPLDHRNEGWLEQEIHFADGHALIIGKLSDLQGRFNINLLAQQQQDKAKQQQYTESQEMFIRLLQALPLEIPIDQAMAIDITNAVIDWLDKDPDGIEKERLPGGAEDYYYADAEPAGRVANREMVSLSELRLVKGITSEIYHALKPFLTLWGTKININTASGEVLRSMNKPGVLVPLEQVDIQHILAQQGEDAEGFETTEVLNSSPLKELQLGIALYTVDSNYFLLQAEVFYLDRSYKLQSIIAENGERVEVVARSQTVL